MARECVIVGNWKMYKTIDESVGFVHALSKNLSDTAPAVYLAVPFTAIKPVAEAAGKHPIVVGAQNMNDASEGAFTGEIAARMLTNAGAKFVLLGHSERRQLFGETNALVNKKVRRALDEGLEPIVCVGETGPERESGQTDAVLRKQIEESLAGIKEGVIVAYEPVWAIGTGKTATPEIAQEAHEKVRALIGEVCGATFAAKCTLLYGGSVKPDNAAALLAQHDIDGVLVGGASLDANSFAEIVRAATAKV